MSGSGFEMGKIDGKVLHGAGVELLATAIFVYIGTGSAASTGEFLAQTGDSGVVARLLPISMAFGVGIMVLVYAFGHISGGHINPAVTLMLVLVKACSPVMGLVYIIAQLIGAIIGSLCLWGSISNLSLRNVSEFDLVGSQLGASANNPPFNLGANTLNPGISPGNGFMFEFMGTLLLCLTVAFTAVHKGSMAEGKPSNAPIAIGFAVMLAHIVLVPFTGCGINPARTFGPAVVNSFVGETFVWNDSWIYYVGPFTASVISAAMYKFISCNNDKYAEAGAQPDAENQHTTDQTDNTNTKDIKEN